MNYVIMSGHLLQDPEQRQSQEGKTYVTGRIGVSQGKDQNGEYKPSIIFEFTCFGYDINTIMLAKKGDSITVAGRLQESTNVSQTNGQTYVNKRIIANNVTVNIKPQLVNQQPVQNAPMYNQQPVQNTPMYNQQPVQNTPMYTDPFRSGVNYGA